MLALARSARSPGPLHVPGAPLKWDDQSLAAFESRPVTELTQRYDLLVLDHPGLGAAVHTNSLTPLDDLFDGAELETWARETVGMSFNSYRYLGHQWALPIDAAAQVYAIRDAAWNGQPTGTWAEVVDAEFRTAIPTAAPHTLLTFLGLCAAHDPTFTPGQRLAAREIMEPALELLAALVTATPGRYLNCNPIEILDRISHPIGAEPPVSAPLIFGYVTYARKSNTHPIRFLDAPSITAKGVPGSVLGGAGVALSRRTDYRQAVAHLRQIMHPSAQTQVIPSAGGQPAAVAAWEDLSINEHSLDFYQNTRRSHDNAWRRPRYRGWIDFQRLGSQLLFDGLAQHRSSAEILDELDQCYKAFRAADAVN